MCANCLMKKDYFSSCMTQCDVYTKVNNTIDIGFLNAVILLLTNNKHD